MSWNAKPGSSALPPPAYPRKRSPFPEQPFRSPLGSTLQSSLTYPGQSPEACAFLGSSDLATQPQLGHPQAQLRNYSAASVQSGAVVTSQTSVQRVTYVSIRPKALDHSVQVSPGLAHGTWRNPALQHTAASAVPQSSFGTKAPAMVQALQSQFVTSDTYSMQLQMVPVSSSRAPESCQGSSRLSPTPLQGFPGPWTQQPHTSSGLACPEYRPPQHTYSSSFLPEPALHKPSPLPARNNLPPGSGLILPTQQAIPGQPFQCSAVQPDARVASYSCSYTGQPLPSPQHLPKHVAAEPPRSQEPHTPDSRKEFCGRFRPLWPKVPENLSTLGTFCNMKVSNSTGEPFHSPTGASVPSEPFHRPAGASMPGEPFHGPTGASVPGEPFHGLTGAAMPGEPFHGTTGAAMPGEPFHGPAGTAVPGESFLRPAGTVVPRESFHGPTRASMPREPFQGPTRASMPRESFHGPAGASIPGEPFHGPMRASVPSESFHEPTRVSMPSMQTIVPRRLEKRVAPCTLPPNSALDTNVAKEKLVRDIKTLVEIKNKFSELARKIKINKELLMAAGCIKTTSAPYSDSAPNPELAQKESGGVHSGSLFSLLTSGATENKELDREGGRPASPRELGSGLHGPLCPEVLPVLAQGQGQQAQTTSQAAVEGAAAAGSSTSCSAGGFASIEESAPAGLEAPSAFPPQSPCEAKDKYLHKHPIILRLLEVRDHTAQGQGKLMKGAHETLQASKPPGPEVSPGDPVPGQLLWRTPEVTGPCNAGTKDTGHTLPQDLPSPSGGAHPKGESPCSMELLATCLSLWRNSPVGPAKDMPQGQPASSPAAPGPCSKNGLVEGTSGSRAAPSPQDSAQPGAPQNHETPGVAVSKGTELQIAVVTPLVLSSAKPLDVKGDAPEVVYPVIKEGSVCSLQGRLAEEAGDPAALKASVAGPVADPEDTPRLSPAQGGSEDTPRLCPRQQTQAEPGGPLPSNGDGESGSENRLQIGNICSLLEGTMSYNPQIAEMFSVPECPVEPGQGDSRLAEDRGVGPQSQAAVQGAVLSGKSARGSAPPQTPEPASLGTPEPEPTSQCPPEPALPQLPAPTSLHPPAPAPPLPEPPAPLHPVGERRATMQASGLGCHVEKAGLVFDLGPVTATPDVPCEDRAPGSTEKGTLEDETPVLYLHDQLSELLKEFPYGVAPVRTCEAPASWRLPRRGWKRPQPRKPVSAATATATEEQIQITILNSEQMKALFSEQDLQELDTEPEPQKGELVCKEGTPPAVGGEEGGQQGAQAQVTEDGSQGDPPAQLSEGNQGDPPAQLSEEGHQQGPQAQVSEERWGDALVQVTEEGSQGDAQGQVSEEGRQGDTPAQGSEDRGQGGPTTQAVRAECPENTPVDPQKDDLPCCALGWLSAVYEGVPQCQCSLAHSRRSTKPTKRKSGQPPASQDALKRQHREGSLERDGPRHHSPLVGPDKKRPFLGSGKEDRAKVKASDPRKTQQALAGQRLHSQARPGGGKAPASEVTVLKASDAARSSQENQPRKQPVPSPQLLKAKVGFLSHKTKELHRSLGPRKLLLKVGVAGHKAWDKRKSDDGGALDSATKRRKVDGPEQSRAEGPAGSVGYSSSRKTWGSVSLSKEGDYRKERLGPQVKGVGTVDGSPKAQRPVSPKAQRPVSPKAQRPVSPKAQRPVSPKLQRPGSPKPRRPGSPKAQRPGSPGPTQRHKHKEAAAAKTSRKDPRKARHRDKQVPRHSKPSQAHPKPVGSRPAPEEATRAGASFVKSHQPHTGESKTHSSRTEKQAGGKPQEHPWTEKNQSHRHSGSAGPAAAPAKDHKKLYLNRVGFQCTERQSICLTQLDPSPRKPHREKSRETAGPQGAGRPGMLEFKLCPESMIPKTGLGDEHALLQPGPQKEQELAQVSGIRSSKEDWLKCVTEERRPDATQGIDSRVVGNPRLSKRALSADGAVGAQTPPQDFQAMFQTYRKMYMEKRSRSLGSSPLK